jgi:hypothetical protein
MCDRVGGGLGAFGIGEGRGMVGGALMEGSWNGIVGSLFKTGGCSLVQFGHSTGRLVRYTKKCASVDPLAKSG